MSYSLSIPLKAKIDPSNLLELFVTPYSRINDYIYASNIFEDHSYVKKLKNAIYCDYRSLPSEVRYYLYFLAGKLATKYGLTKTCKENNKKYPYFFYDKQIVYVIPKSDLIDFGDLMQDNFDIHVDENVDDINIHAHVKRENISCSDKEFNELFGDNDLLKEYCKSLLVQLNK